jgi:hypothetical protein
MRQFDPNVIAKAIDEMWWPELDQLYPQLLNAMEMTAEASGASLELRVNSGKPGGSPPTGDVSLVDHWRPRIQAAVIDDLADDANGQAPRRLRTVVLCAAVALWEVQHRSIREPGPEDATDLDIDREERMATAYEGFSPHTVAALETARGGFVTASAVRSCRRMNDRHPETGTVVPQRGAERAAEALRLRYELRPDGKSHSLADIGRILGCAPSTVMRMLPKETQLDQKEAA